MSDSRLFKILYYLLDKGNATAPELAAAFEVSSRTIYRDIEALSGAGIPVYTEPGRNGGISLLHDFILDRTIYRNMNARNYWPPCRAFLPPAIPPQRKSKPNYRRFSIQPLKTGLK